MEGQGSSWLVFSNHWIDISGGTGLDNNDDDYKNYVDNDIDNLLSVPPRVHRGAAGAGGGIQVWSRNSTFRVKLDLACDYFKLKELAEFIDTVCTGSASSPRRTWRTSPPST